MGQRARAHAARRTDFGVAWRELHVLRAVAMGVAAGSRLSGAVWVVQGCNFYAVRGGATVELTARRCHRSVLMVLLVARRPVTYTSAGEERACPPTEDRGIGNRGCWRAAHCIPP